ncbi:MAG TPA: hypothetical protein VMX17_11980 [Candidatus Glassbacteria bacterium]|nr:hypothetical protein [Candidatus Glassbacteria bacterium]
MNLIGDDFMFMELELEIEEPTMPKDKSECECEKDDESRGVCVIDLNGSGISIIKDILESK